MFKNDNFIEEKLLFRIFCRCAPKAREKIVTIIGEICAAGKNFFERFLLFEIFNEILTLFAISEKSTFARRRRARKFWYKDKDFA